MLASSPSSMVTSWQAHDINRYVFYTNAKDKKSVTYQNSCIRIEAANANGHAMSYYGYIDTIWELNYWGNLRIAVFKCQWIKSSNVDNYWFTTLVDLGNVRYKDDQWVVCRTGFLHNRPLEIEEAYCDLRKAKNSRCWWHNRSWGIQSVWGIGALLGFQQQHLRVSLSLVYSFPCVIGHLMR